MTSVRGVRPPYACDPGSDSPAYASTSVSRTATVPSSLRCSTTRPSSAGAASRTGADSRAAGSSGSALTRTWCRAPGGSATAGYLRAEPDQGVVPPVDDPLLERDQGVVGDLDVLGADLGAALGDVAQAQPEAVLGVVLAVQGVERVHVELRDPHQVTGAGEGSLVVLVVADDVAGVLAQEALDALAELLRALDVDLLHPVLPGLQVGRRGEGRDLPRLGVVERHIRDQVAQHREGAQRRDRHHVGLREDAHPRHAQQPRTAVHLRTAGPALAGLAVPAHGQVGSLGRLQPVNDVEHDLALVDLDVVVGQRAALVVPAPDPELPLVGHDAPRCSPGPVPSSAASSSTVRYFPSSSRSNKAARSARRAGTGWRVSSTPLPSSRSRQTRLTPRQPGSMPG